MDIDPRLIGRWKPLYDENSKYANIIREHKLENIDDKLTLTFRDDGTSTIYSVWINNRNKEITHQYRIMGNQIITDNKDKEDNGITEYSISDEGVLTLKRDKYESKWIKVEEA